MANTVNTFLSSFAQRRLWFIQQLAPASTAYNMVVTAPLPPPVEPELVQSAIDALVARHEVLRTSFALESDDVVQRVAPVARLGLFVHRFESPSALGAVVAESASEPFDLAAAPLVRAHLGLSPNEPTANLALVVHHIIADGETLRILLEDLVSALCALREGRAAVLPATPVEYADYAVWQRRSLTGRKLESLRGYWTQRLQALPELRLPKDRARPETGASRGGVQTLHVDDATAAQLRALAASSSASLFTVLLAGFAALLSRISGQSDFGIGIPVSGRSRTELERVAGLFVNSLVYRCEVTPELAFDELVRRTAAALADDLSHQEMPFELVVDALRVPRRADRNPLFQVMCQLQVRGPRSRAIGAAEGEREPAVLDADKLSSQVDLSLMLFDSGEGPIEGGFVYAAELFDRESIAQWAEAYCALLSAATRSPSIAIGELPLAEPRRVRALLELGEGPRREWPGPSLLHEWFAERARSQPDAIAVESREGAASFGELDRRSDRIAGALQELGVVPGDVVAACLPRSIACVASILGILKAGAAYLLLDAAAPRAHLEFVAGDSRARAVIVPPGRSDLAFGRPALDVDDLGSSSDERTVVAPTPQSPAYVIYTSGSTGRPKGVAIPHAAIVNHMRWMFEQFDWRADERVLQRTPLSFDASVWEFWAPLLSGSTLVLADADGPFDPARVLAQLQRERITTLQVVPSMLGALLDRPEASRCAALRRVFCGGEVLPAALVQRATATLGAEIVNLYGPSETTIDATFHRCDPSSSEPEIPIGRPIANVVARVLDDRLRPVLCGMTGELFVGGDAVGIGYLGREELNAERFVRDPHAPGGRLFRTGDLVTMDRAGVLRFRGRRDEQVKLRGFRVELGDVEAQLAAHPAIAEAAAVVQEPVAGDQRLVAFVRLHRDATATARELLAWLQARVPAYSVPSRMELCDGLPKNAHGKVDRRTLRDWRLVREAQPPAGSAPRSSIEVEICRSFAAALAVEHVDIDDDFFLLGGHSLLVVTVCAALSRELGVEVNVVDLFEFPRPRELAHALNQRASHTPRAAQAGAVQESAATLRGGVR